MAVRHNVGLSVEETGVSIHRLPFRNLYNFVHPTLPASFGRDSKSLWFLLSGVYARGGERSYAGKIKKIYRGLIISSSGHSEINPQRNIPVRLC